MVDQNKNYSFLKVLLTHFAANFCGNFLSRLVKEEIQYRKNVVEKTLLFSPFFGRNHVYTNILKQTFF